jgi:HAD superfamily phosphatase (TIGR01668 family)
MGAFQDILTIIRRVIIPNYHYDTILDIPLNELYEQGHRAILMDVDNTILPRSKKEISLQMSNWVDTAKRIGYKVLFVSNNSSFRRINKVAKQVEVEGLHFACKPLIYSTRYLLKRHNLNPEKCLYLGDQMLTDVVMGNWNRMTTILVDPYDKRLSVIKAIQHEVEKKLMAWFKP